MGSLDLHAIIMAGGSGTRFWPRSRRALPKQFLRIGGTRTLLRETFERLVPLTGLGAVGVVTGGEHVDRVHREVPELPASNILAEPVGRDTAACIGIAAEWLLARGAGDDTLMLVCPSDHVIQPPARFEEAVRFAASLARSADSLVTFGIRPRGPSSAFGYIQRGPLMEKAGEMNAYRVLRFAEKPDRVQAEEFLRGGDYYWNSGIFVWRVGAIRSAISRFFPDLAAGLEPMGRDLRRGESAARVLAGGFGSLPKNSIDRGVLEKAAREGRVLVVEAPFDWDDVGSWNAMARYLPRTPEGNQVEGRHVGLYTSGCLISGSGRRLIATIGVRDLVVVETDDAILICHRDQVEKIRELVERLGELGEGDRI